ncbi:PRTRC system protein C [Robbsia andropogonis]|uniref:PRTRC system protein C n=1 Tax=Robbsia andropogonis TaxID=28092 RepID=UPI0020A0B40E|nr:PRTRC system protein C [Robbsia andropogonis]MCP1121029.1 PRTRC system protein C [Robbsia andropogonis]MCP1130790.1 PRTRC system protein C [Robbsia andropogonis]
MSISIRKAIREFSYNGMTFADPGPQFSVLEVRDLYSAQYPELTTASVNGPETSGAIMRYTFLRAAGAKGCYA